MLDFEQAYTPGPGELRVTALRDAITTAAATLDGVADPAAVAAQIRDAFGELEPGDLGNEQAMVSRQLAMCLDHLDKVAGEHPGIVEGGERGLGNDARFLRDMADFMTRRFGLLDPDADTEDEGR